MTGLAVPKVIHEIWLAVAMGVGSGGGGAGSPSPWIFKHGTNIVEA